MRNERWISSKVGSIRETFSRQHGASRLGDRPSTWRVGETTGPTAWTYPTAVRNEQVPTMVLFDLLEILALAIWLAAIGWRATGHGPRRGRFVHRYPGPPPPDYGGRPQGLPSGFVKQARA